jgi:hypothetical protein
VITVLLSFGLVGRRRLARDQPAQRVAAQLERLDDPAQEGGAEPGRDAEPRQHDGELAAACLDRSARAEHHA